MYDSLKLIVQFVSLVGSADWVATNQVRNATTLYLDIVSLLQLIKTRERRGGGRRRKKARGVPMGLIGWSKWRIEPKTLRCRDPVFRGEWPGPISLSLEDTESKMCDIELRVYQIECTWWVESPGAERRSLSFRWRNQCNVLHDDGYTRGREHCATRLTSGNSS
jgi:hypothetical protein